MDRRLETIRVNYHSFILTIRVNNRFFNMINTSKEQIYYHTLPCLLFLTISSHSWELWTDLKLSSPLKFLLIPLFFYTYDSSFFLVLSLSLSHFLSKSLPPCFSFSFFLNLNFLSGRGIIFQTCSHINNA